MKNIKYLLTILLWLLLAFIITGQTRQELDKIPNVAKSEIDGLTVYGIADKNEIFVYVFYQDLLLGTGFSPSAQASSVLKHIENTYLFLRNLNGGSGLYLDLKSQQLLLIIPFYTENGLRFLIINIKEELWK